MNCASCGALNSAANRFCGNCGTPLPLACAACGAENPPAQNFCGQCGQALAAALPGATAPHHGAGDQATRETTRGAAVQPDLHAQHRGAPGAERRQLTVMFCDLVGSTALANQLDPEDWQTVIRSFHAAVAQAVAAYEGHVAQLLGDGVLVYFGYPRAHEDDADRAVRAALAVMPEVAALVLPAAAALAPAGPTKLQARIGIATGRVVIGEIGAGTPAAEQSASGETPNLAARLQALAAPGEIVLAQATHDLIGASFELAELGAVPLKGFAAPVRAWRVHAERAAASRFEARQSQALGSCIGRDSEIALLVDRWERARDGEAQAVLLTGEAGIGKSRVCQALRERLRDEPHSVIVLQCSPYFSGSALYPVVQQLQRAAGVTADDAPAQRRAKLQNVTRSLPSDAVHALLSVLGMAAADGAPATPVSGADAAEPATTPQQTKSQALRALVELVREAAAERATLLWVEDAHWIDPTTQEWLALLLDQLRESRLLTVITTRPPEELALGSPAHLTRLTLTRLSQRQCSALIDAVTLGKPLPAEVQDQIIRKTDGVPLFVEELTKTVLQSGLLEDSPQGYRLTQALPELAIPSTLADSLMARLDRLSAAKSVAQAGAAIGREFSHRLLACVMHGEATPLDPALAGLIDAGLLVRRGVAPEFSYQFKHALVRDTAYNSMLKSQRVLRHRQIAAALESTSPELVGAQPELIAYHLQEGGHQREAVGHWAKAGKQTISRAAYSEAIEFFEQALRLLEDEAPTVHVMGEMLDIRLDLGVALYAFVGADARTEATYLKAIELVEQLGDGSRRFPALWGLWTVNYFRGRYRAARQAAEGLLEAAHDSDDVEQLLEAHHALWSTLTAMGRPIEALVHLEQGGALYNSGQHASLRFLYGAHDPGICCAIHMAQTRWLLGFPDQALHELEKVLGRVEDMRHPLTAAITLTWAAWLYSQRGDTELLADAAKRLAESQRRTRHFAWVEERVLQLSAAVGEPPSAQILDDLHRKALRSKGLKSRDVFIRCTLAELYALSGDPVGGLHVLSSISGDERDDLQAAEVYRLEGSLMLQRAAPDASAAERCFHQAVAVAREQGARSFELRAATSLAELWQQQGKADEARRLLGDIYGWFTEGFETTDLRRAKALLDELRSGAVA